MNLCSPRFALAILSLLLAGGAAAAAAEATLDAGIRQLESGDPAAARATLQRVVASGGDERPRALAYLGLASLAQDDHDAAIGHLQEAVDLVPDDSMFRTWLGRAYIRKLQTVSFFEKGVLSGRALETLQEAVELDPANVEARVTLAGYYLNAPALAGGSKRKARRQAEAIRELDPGRGHRILAGIHAADEEYELAVDELGRCLASRPGDLECRYDLAMIHQRLERWDEAFAAFEGILALEPDSRSALYQLGRTAVFSGARLERGIQCLEAYLTLEPRSGHPGLDAAHWRLGMLFQHRGDRQRARREFETALALAPDSEPYRAALASLGDG